jgi:RNA polymerase II subunit A C-terminal domain phosphatase
MHVYTMGTRAYAEEVCKAIDPEGRFFCGRILSRDESGSERVFSIYHLDWLTYYDHKALHRRASNGYFLLTHRWLSSLMTAPMFGNGAQIWSRSFHVRIPFPFQVDPFLNMPTDDFFVGIGDINSTFLPKLDPSTSTVPQTSPATPGQQPQTVLGSTLPTSSPSPSSDDSQSSTISTSSADEEVDTEILQKEMIARNSLALEAQVEERPLAKLQEELQEAANDQLESESPASSVSGQSENTSKPSETPGEKHHRKALLKNDDVELRRIKRVSCVFL